MKNKGEKELDSRKKLKFIKNINDEFSTKLNDYIANVYEYVEGDTVSHNSLDESLVNECATILSKINIILKDFKLNDGISKEFFKLQITATFAILNMMRIH